MSYSNSANFFLRANSTHWDTFYRGPDGEYRWGAAAEATWEGLQYWFYAFDNGLLDPEFFVLTHEQDMEKFQNLGIAGISYLGGQTADMERFRIDFNDFTGHPREAFLIATLLGESGHYHQRDLINYWGAVFFNPDVDTAVFERWMYLMEWTASPDGYVHTAMGIRGSSWDRDADGNIISLVPEGTLMDGPVGVARYPGLGHVMGSIILWDDLAFDNPNIGLAYRQESRALYANRYEFGTPETFTQVDWDLWTHDSPAMRWARAINYEQSFANLVATANSLEHLEELYLSWLESQMAIIQPALDELNAR
jgi:putative aldouronate transport system substrate-binding protein